MINPEVVKLIKGDNPVVCSPERAQYYLDRGWEIVGSKRRRTPVGATKDVIEEDVIETSIEGGSLNRQEIITNAVEAIFNRNDPDEFTGGGLPRIEVIAAESGLEDVTGQERSIAMEDSNLGGI